MKADIPALVEAMPQDEKDDLLIRLISFAFEDGGELNLDKDVPGGDFVDEFTHAVHPMIERALEDPS